MRFTVDSRNAAANQLSNFNARTGVAAQVYVVYSGSIKLTRTSNKVTGTVDLVGRGFISHGFAPYRAVLSGRPIKSGQLSV